jgi:hypothetical protein
MRENHTELLLLPNGRILVHNLTPAMAALLKELDLQDDEMALRSSLATAGTLPGSVANDPSPSLKPGHVSARRSVRRAPNLVSLQAFPKHELPDRT